MKQVFIYIILGVIFSSCKKQISNIGRPGVFTVPEQFDQECVYLYPASDGGCIAITATTDHAQQRFLGVSKFSKDGKVLWTKTLTGYCTSQSICETPDGGIMMFTDNYDTRLVKLTATGEIIFNRDVSDSSHYGYSTPVLDENGHVYTVYKKPAAWLANTNEILEFDENGNSLLKKTILTYDGLFGGLLNNQVLYQVDAPGTFHFCGLIYKNPVNLVSNPRVFVAKIEYDSMKQLKNKKITFLDPLNEDQINEANDFNHLKTADGNLIISLSRIATGNRIKMHLFKIDPNHNILWERDLIMGNGNTRLSSIRNCPDGNYFLAGSCRVPGKSFNQTFVAKLDVSGNTLWFNIMDLPLNSHFNTGIQIQDGSTFNGGYTNSFGNGINLYDMLMVRTDANGNLK